MFNFFKKKKREIKKSNIIPLRVQNKNQELFKDITIRLKAKTPTGADFRVYHGEKAYQCDGSRGLMELIYRLTYKL